MCRWSHTYSSWLKSLENVELARQRLLMHSIYLPFTVAINCQVDDTNAVGPMQKNHSKGPDRTSSSKQQRAFESIHIVKDNFNHRWRGYKRWCLACIRRKLWWTATLVDALAYSVDNEHARHGRWRLYGVYLKGTFFSEYMVCRAYDTSGQDCWGSGTVGACFRCPQ
jgi:hypothetical protein